MGMKLERKISRACRRDSAVIWKSPRLTTATECTMSKPVSNFVCCSLLFAVFFWCQHVSAQSPAATDVADVFQDCVSNCAPEPLCTGDIWTRPQLTGDWHGYRSSLRNSGITLGGSLTQFAFGVSGGLGPNPPALKPGAPLIPGDTFAYTGRGDYRAIVDLEKFGGLPKGTLFVQIQQWFGQYGLHNRTIPAHFS